VASAGLDVQISPLATIGINHAGQIGDCAKTMPSREASAINGDDLLP
jgi:hypothetical protein